MISDPIVFTYTPFAVCALTVALFVLRERFSVRTKVFWSVLLLVAFAKFLCFAEFGGHVFSPVLPAAVIWTWDFLYSGATILCALSVLFFFRFRGKRWILPLVAWGLSAWGLFEGLRAPDVREVELHFAELPASLDGYRIVQLADLHCSCSARRWRTQAVVDAANALQPDLVCLTGDNADGPVGVVGPFLEPLKELRAKDGVYACLGNHEYYHDYAAWMTNFYAHATNVRWLMNDWTCPHPDLALGGLSPFVDRRRVFSSATNGEFRVLLQHHPKVACENVKKLGVRLQLSGHTHGGIAPPFRRFIAGFNGGFVRGLYPIGDAWLYVSPGCGQWAGFPMRILNPSEITLIVLRSGM